jgi:hypothetical protein
VQLHHEPDHVNPKNHYCELLVDCNNCFAPKFEEPFDELRVIGQGQKAFVVRHSNHER